MIVGFSSFGLMGRMISLSFTFLKLFADPDVSIFLIPR